MAKGVKTIVRRLAFLLLVLTAGLLAGCAEPGPQQTGAAGGSQPYSQAELDQMLAPIALYPDTLLSQLLMASTYPLEVVEAARWSREHPDDRGDRAVRAVEDKNWDPSVKSLVAFPRILETMDKHLQWTENLGNAFLSQQAGVMDTVQKLRHKAYDAGTLRSTHQITVVVSGSYIYIKYARHDVVYVPYYDPTVVFGVWWWVGYPPMYWAPWPGYYVASGFGWGPAVKVSPRFFFGDCDWRKRRVDVVNVHSFYYAPRRGRQAAASRYLNRTPGAWRHDPAHRRGMPYRDRRLSNEYGRPYQPRKRFFEPRRRMPGEFRGGWRQEGGFGAPGGRGGWGNGGGRGRGGWGNGGGMGGGWGDGGGMGRGGGGGGHGRFR